MSGVKVISISKDYEPILSFLYPSYSLTDSVSVVSKFITHRDITSKAERDALDFIYSDCVFISNQIFDEVWDEEKIKQECINFSRVNFKNRKTKFSITSSFVDDCINFMFGLVDDEQEQSIFELFDSFGSVLFVKSFVQKSLTIPVSVLNSSMTTFLIKTLSSDNSVYYKKKHINFNDKIRTNLFKSLDSFILSERDDFGLSSAKFYCDLVD